MQLDKKSEQDTCELMHALMRRNSKWGSRIDQTPVNDPCIKEICELTTGNVSFALVTEGSSLEVLKRTTKDYAS